MCQTHAMQVPEVRRPLVSYPECNHMNSFFEDMYSASFRNRLYDMVEEIEEERAKYCNSANPSCSDAFDVDRETCEEEFKQEEVEDSLCSLDIKDDWETCGEVSEDLTCDNCGSSLRFLADVVKRNDMCFCSLDCYTSSLLKGHPKGLDLQENISYTILPTWHEKYWHDA